MSRAHTPGTVDPEVLKEEQIRLAQRRNAAGFQATDAPTDQPINSTNHSAGTVQGNGTEGANEASKSPRSRGEIAPSAVGLAISGGGIRSASFGLGILQAFYRGGLLRFCDYLSTVSGGSYVGAFVTSLAQHEHSAMKWQPPADAQTAARLPPSEVHRGNGQATAVSPSLEVDRVTIEPDQFRRQSSFVQRLIYGGSYLNQPLLFVNNWLPGFLLINIVALSSLVAVCGIAAYFFRLMYRQDFMRVLSSLGFGDDISMSFFPAVFLFVIWASYLIVKSFLAFFRGARVTTPTAKRLTFAMLVVTGLCAVSLLGIGDIDTDTLLHRLGINISRETKQHMKSLMQWAFYTLVIVGILPYLTPERLLRSGMADNPRFGERTIFQIATTMLFWGCPLAVFAFLARENISCYNTWRDNRYQLTRSSLQHWEDFWGKVKADYTATQDAKKLGNQNTTTKTAQNSTAQATQVSTVNASSEPTSDPDKNATPTTSAAAAIAVLPKIDRSTLAAPSAEFWDRISKVTVPDLPSQPKFVPPLIPVDKRAPIINYAQTGNKAPSETPATSLIEGITAGTLRKNERDGKVYLPERWSSAALWAIGAGENNTFDDLVNSEWRLYCDRDLAVACLNYALLNEEFHTIFKDLADQLKEDPKFERTAFEHSLGFAGDPQTLLTAYYAARDAARNFMVPSKPADGDSSLDPDSSPSPTSISDPDKDRSDRDRVYLDRLRELRKADAVYTYHLALHPERYIRRNDWLGEREQIRELLKNPNRLMQEQDEEQENRIALMHQHVKGLEKANFELLKAFYGAPISSPDVVYASVVTDTDQSIRLSIVGIAAAVFLVTSFLMDLNHTTIHNFYRDQLSSVWIVRSRSNESLPLGKITADERGAPYLLINCATTFLRKSKNDDEPTDSFVLSPAACGSDRFGYAPTNSFDGGKFTLADAMAISGAAVTPAASPNLAVRALLWLLNFRLGQWLPNPAVASLRQTPLFYRPIWRRPHVLHLLLSRLLMPQHDQDFLFVSDGGLHENLGIESLLVRRCRFIIAVDGGADPNGQFEDLVKLLLRIRVRYGITIGGIQDGSPLPLSDLCASAGNAPSPAPLGGLSSAPHALCSSHFVLARICYPEDSPDNPAYLLYIRPGFVGKEWEELNRYRVQNEKFPHDNTVDQFYSPARFEAYRLLGEYIGTQVNHELMQRVCDAKNHESLMEAVAQLTADLNKKLAVEKDQEKSPTCDDASQKGKTKVVELAEGILDHVRAEPAEVDEAKEKAQELLEALSDTEAEEPDPVPVD